MKKIIIITSVIVLAIILVTIALRFSSKNQPTVSSLIQPTVKQTAILSSTLKEYRNPSGFKFSYPDNLVVSPKTTLEETIYAQLKITSASASGNIEIKIETNNFINLDEWFEKNAISTAEGEMKNITLADLEGKQFTTPSQIVTVASDKETVTSIKADIYKEKEFWTAAQEKIISTFAFALPEAETTSPTTDVGEIIDEGEEIIE